MDPEMTELMLKSVCGWSFCSVKETWECTMDINVCVNIIRRLAGLAGFVGQSWKELLN